MGVAKLEVLGMEVNTGWLTRYYDDGFVDDLDEYIARLHKRYKRANTSSDSVKNADGYCVVYERAIGIFYPVHPIVLFRMKDIHICYLDAGDEVLNIQHRAHEEAHALDYMGKFSLLENALCEIVHEIPAKMWNHYFGDFDPNLPCSIKESDENRAKMGELYALHKYFLGLRKAGKLATAEPTF